MRERGIAERAAFVPAVIGPVVGALFLFAPIHGWCMTTITGTPGAPATPGPTTCGTEALWQRQALFPMPFFAVLVWSIAPLLAYAGVRMRVGGSRRAGTALVVFAILLESTVLVSFGAAPMFVPFVWLPLMAASAVALTRS